MTAGHCANHQHTVQQCPPLSSLTRWSDCPRCCSLPDTTPSGPLLLLTRLNTITCPTGSLELLQHPPTTRLEHDNSRKLSWLSGMVSNLQLGAAPAPGLCVQEGNAAEEDLCVAVSTPKDQDVAPV